MNARSIRFAALILVVGAGLAAEARAAVVTWQTPADIAAGADVNTLGTQVFGRNIGLAYNNPSATVNGVNFGFNNPGWSVTFSETAALNFGAAAPAMGGPDAANYEAIMETARYNGTTTQSFTLGNLTLGRIYLLQLWVGDWRGFPNNRTETITANAPNTNVNTPTLAYLDSDGPIHGQYVIGTWIADATSVTFTLLSNEGSHYNALQLRAIPTPAALPAGLAMLGLAAARRPRRPNA